MLPDVTGWSVTGSTNASLSSKEKRGKSAKPGNSSLPLPTPLPQHVAQNGQAPEEALSTQVKRSRPQPQSSRRRNAPTTTEPNLEHSTTNHPWSQQKEAIGMVWGRKRMDRWAKFHLVWIAARCFARGAVLLRDHWMDWLVVIIKKERNGCSALLCFE